MLCLDSSHTHRAAVALSFTQSGNMSSGVLRHTKTFIRLSGNLSVYSALLTQNVIYGTESS